MTYNGLGQAKRLTAGSTTTVNDALGLEEAVTGSTATLFTRTPDGTIVGYRQSNTPYYFTFDGLGSVTGLVNNSGATQELFSYSPYGTRSGASASCTRYEPIGFANGYSDSADGNEALVKFGERYYDPSTGRWTQMDPIDNPLNLQGWDGYDYAGDDPTSSVDPSGTSTENGRCGSSDVRGGGVYCGGLRRAAWCSKSRWTWNQCYGGGGLPCRFVVDFLLGLRDLRLGDPSVGAPGVADLLCDRPKAPTA